MAIKSTENAAPHGFVTKSIHWLSMLLIGYGYFKGLNNVNQLADPDLLRFEVVFALGMGAVFLFRLFWTHKIVGATRLPDVAPKWEKLLASIVHKGLYASVFAIIGSGLAIAYAFTSPLLDGIFMDAMIALHGASLVVLPALIIIHIAGALWHKFIRRDGVLESMTGRLPI